MRRPRAIPTFSKVNLGLEVKGRRADGYHELVTLLQTISFGDRMLVARRREPGLLLTCSDPSVPADGTNLVARAYDALAECVGTLPGLAIHLEKRVPAGAGLGGGSGDAGALLLALDRWLGLGVGRARLLEMAASLGSDVPFFLWGGMALGLGRGEIVVPLQDLEPLEVVLALPPVHISTAAAYGRGGRRKSATGGERSRILDFLASGSGIEELHRLGNDLIPAARPLILMYDHVTGILRDAGAEHVLMSGSGSTIFGLFKRSPEARVAAGRLSKLAGHRAILARTVSRRVYQRRVAKAVEGRGSPAR